MLSDDFDLKSNGVILQKTDLPFENGGVLNPACIERAGFIHMFYRAATDQNRSTIGYAKLDGENNVVFRMDRPFLFSEFDYESYGLEDPRIVCIDGVYYLFYTAFDGKNSRVAYAQSVDLITFEKKGLVSPAITYAEVLSILNREKLPEKYFWFGEHYQKIFSKNILLWEKDFFLFPRKIGGKFAVLHRVLPGIQLITVDRLDELQDIEFWKNYLQRLEDAIVLDPKFWFEGRLIGGGAPAVETPHGWLMIYHAAEDPYPSRVYRACAALLDLRNPRKVIGRLREPLFSPTEPWEKKGVVNNVVFPTSALLRGGRLHIYYGAADYCIAVRSLDLTRLLGVLMKSK